MKLQVATLAMDALNELAKDDRLEDRLAYAWMKLAGIVQADGNDWLEDAAEVRRAYKEVAHSFAHDSVGARAEVLQSLIIAILIEFGYCRAVRELSE